MTTAHRICKHGVVDHPYAPEPFTHVVITTLDRHRIAMHPICNFKQAVEDAIRWADTPRHWEAQVEVRCWSLSDLCHALRIDPETFAPGITVDHVVATLKEALHESDDYLVRREAKDQLVQLGVTR
jgi:hypothetical protein